jgi:hypothetical protein
LGEPAPEQSGGDVGRVARRHRRIDAAAIFVGSDLGDGYAACGQEALQRGARRFRFQIFAGAAGMKLGRIDCAQPDPGIDLEA